MPFRIEHIGGSKKVLAKIHELFGSGVTPEDVAEAAGAHPDARVLFHRMADSLFVETEHPHLQTTRIFHRLPDSLGGSLVVEHASQDTHPSYRGNGTERFAAAAKKLQSLGVKRIYADAAGSPSDPRKYVGFHIWPSCGFDGIIGKQTATKLGLPGPTTLHELFSTEEGNALWRAKGHGIKVHFDLTESSEHWKRLNARLSQRQQKREQQNGQSSISSENSPEAGVRDPEQGRSGGNGDGTGTGSGESGTPGPDQDGSGLDGRVSRAFRGLRRRLQRQRELRLKYEHEQEYQYQNPYENTTAHPLVAGFQIEHALRHLVTDPNTDSISRALAHQGLHHGDTNAIYYLHDALQEYGHSLHGHYNWMNAAWKLHLDSEMERVVNEHTDSHNQEAEEYARERGWEHHPIQPWRVRDDIRMLAREGEKAQPWVLDHSEHAHSIIRELFPHATPADLEESTNRLNRREYRHATDHVEAPPEEKELALTHHDELDNFTPWESGQRPFLHPDELRDIRAQRYRRDNRSTQLGDTINAEFGRLADSVHAATPVPDLDHFKKQNHYGYLLRAANGDHDRAHDMATHLLYGPGSKPSPLAANYDGRPLFRRFQGQVSNLNRYMDQQQQETRSKRFAGNFTNLGLDVRRIRALLKKSRTGDRIRYARPVESSFLDALRRVRSQGQEQLEKIAATIQKSLSLIPASNRAAVHDTDQLSINSVAQAIEHESDPDTIRYAAANWGLLSQTPALMVFHVGVGDGDSIYKVKAKGTGEEIRSALQRHGITQRTLLPHENGFDVLIGDPGRRLSERVRAFAGAVGSPVWESVGTAEVIGAVGDGARASADSRKDYRSIITDYEGNSDRAQAA